MFKKPKKHWLAIPIALFANPIQATEQKSAPPRNKPECGMALPPVQILNNFKGPVSGPFILAGRKDQAGQERTVTILSMNIQSIPAVPVISPTNPDYREDREACLTNLGDEFDAALFQEDFNDRPFDARYTWRPEFEKKYLLKSSLPGLSFQASQAFKRVAAKPYLTKCVGWLADKGDCFATKGYQIIEFENLKIANTHLDAGHKLKKPSEHYVVNANYLARFGQMKEFSDALIKNVDPNEPLLIVGDFNLHSQLPEDQKILQAFIERHGLTIYQRYNSEKGHDFIMGRGLDVNWTGKVEDALLSDHAGLVINLTLPTKPAHPVYASAELR